ncbi:MULTISPECIES: hypothetical protein [Bacillus cereus group]|uniref:hypothetical protein n=1 Tax=Bacillus cereus group TaxID=86661 RepID=UPI000BED0E34|nr:MULTISPECIES: hypothetical protein [Bacillus cereus group]PDY95420.1 hypothetical protein CON09_03450 [Bacillus anthracis]MDW3037874.1 hypothetical protein [Bacillus pacificus]MED1612850.1 hypothetical protein [Bacillus paranthracis]MED1683647.1 hypothetical protein [Bacillus paranthracis]PES20263.1 hypothetical protein CN488_22500 [Bacillus anthracis]
MNIYILLFVIWIVLLGLLIYKLNLLRLEVLRLPKINQKNKYFHPLIDKEINEFLDVPENYSYFEESIIMFTSAQCKMCHDELEKILKNNQHLKNNLILYVQCDEEKKYMDFIREFYKKYKVNILPLSINQQKKLRINVFPSFIQINSEGIIRRVSQIHDKPI